MDDLLKQNKVGGVEGGSLLGHSGGVGGSLFFSPGYMWSLHFSAVSSCSLFFF